MHDESINRLAKTLSEQRIVHKNSDAAGAQLPDRESVTQACQHLLSILFPGFFTRDQNLFGQAIEPFLKQTLSEVSTLLREQITWARRFDCAQHQTSVPEALAAEVNEQLHAFLEALPAITSLVESDVSAAFDNDPAAKCHEEIVAAYPGIQAIAVQRLAHQLYQLEVPLVPRMMTEVAHSQTGIDIHPGARIGKRFAIDHGTGIVIGETTTIGDDCMLYHGVTLGAFNPLGTRNEEGDLVRGPDNKRHPDLENHVTVYPGATILGGQTTIGHHSVIGGNVWLTHSVVPWSTVTIKDPDLLVRNRNTKQAPDFSI